MTYQSEKLTNANNLREQEKFGESAKEYTECLIKQIEDNDHVGQIHSLCGQSLIYKIQERKTSHKSYRDLTIAFARSAINVLESHQSEIDTHTQSVALSSYADALLMDSQITDALTYFERSLAISPASKPEKGRLKAHIGGIFYLQGKTKDSISLIEEALSDIRTGDMNDYAIRVWETGCLNGLAKIFAKENNLEKANTLIDESIKISNDHNLSIRKREAEEIKEIIASGNLDFSL